MNERQAKSQHTLSHGRPLGSDSEQRGDDNDSLKQNPNTVGGEEVEENENKISKSVFGIMLGVGLVLDIIGLIPLIGWGISTMILIFTYIKLGVKFHIKNVIKFGSCDAVKLIPGLSLVPGFVLSVILNLGPMVEGLADEIPGGENIAHAVQKSMSMTKK
jgi:hypothetical protein